MNNRIEELIKEAGPLQDVLSKITEQANQPARYVQNRALLDFQLNRLVELVAKECIAICEQGSETQTTSGGAALLIKQRFDIK